jgi:hypothetical protein
MLKIINNIIEIPQNLVISCKKFAESNYNRSKRAGRNKEQQISCLFHGELGERLFSYFISDDDYVIKPPTDKGFDRYWHLDDRFTIDIKTIMDYCSYAYINKQTMNKTYMFALIKLSKDLKIATLVGFRKSSELEPILILDPKEFLKGYYAKTSMFKL